MIESAHPIKFFEIRKFRNLSNLRNLQITNNQPDIHVDYCKNIVGLYPGIVVIGFRILESADVLGCLSVLSNLQMRDIDIGISRGVDTIV